MNKRVFIFDLDGTLADASHRLHFVQRDNPDWPAFFAACIDDTLITPVWHLLTTLSSNPLNEIWIVTGRSSVVAEETRDWLRQHQVFYDKIFMRSEDDRRKDVAFKEAWLTNLPAYDRARIICAFEDRSRVVDMWRRNGVFCLQTARGDF